MRCEEAEDYAYSIQRETDEVWRFVVLVYIGRVWGGCPSCWDEESEEAGEAEEASCSRRQRSWPDKEAGTLIATGEFKFDDTALAQ